MRCIGLHQDLEKASTRHLKLELQVDRMSDDERKAAADALRRALGLLENDEPRLGLIGSSMSAIGTKRTSASALHMSAFDPKRTSSCLTC